MLEYLLNLEPYRYVRETLWDPPETNCAPRYNNLDRFAPTTSSGFKVQRFTVNG